MDKSWIDRYFEGDLNAEEREALLQKIREDADFRADWEFRNTLKAAVHARERDEMKQFLQGIEKDKGKRRIWLGAAAMLVLVAGLWFYLVRDNTAHLAGFYFHPLPNIAKPVVRNGDSLQTADSAFRAYEAGRYPEAIAEFRKAGDAPYALLYQGVSYLALDSTGRALEMLEGFSTVDKDLETYRKWYLGIACLKAGKKERALELFTALSAYANPVQQEALKLVKELR